MSWLRCVLVLLLGTAGVFASLDASAATTCTANMTDLAFGTADTTTATITYTCVTNTTPSIASEAIVQMCLAIGKGSSPGSTVLQRSMNDGVDKLNFNISDTPGAPSNDWGNSLGTYKTLRIFYPLSGGIFSFRRTGSRTGSITVHGRIPSRSGVAKGTYTSEFGGAETALTFHYDDTLFGSTPSDCENGGAMGQTASFPFNVSADVLGSCSVIAASDMNFTPGGGTISSTTNGLLPSNSTINLTCTKRTAWQVGLDNGLNSSGGSRRMCSPGGACVAYQLYENQTSTPWGSVLDVNTVPGTGNGTTQSLTVKGVIPPNQPLTQAGRYSDTVKVILTY